MKMLDTSCASLKARYDSLYTARQVINSEWDNVTRYVRPYGMRPFLSAEGGEPSIEQRRREHYDGTAPVAAIMLASTLHGAITSERWFDLSYIDTKLNEQTALKDFLEVAGAKIYTELEQSGFMLEAAKVYLDLVTYGTACIFMEPAGKTQWRGVEFTAVDVKEVYFEEDARGAPHTFFRKLKWPMSKWVDHFGYEALPETYQRLYQADPNSRRSLLYVVFPRENFDAVSLPKTLHPTRMPWGYKYIIYDDATPIGPEGGYMDRPVYIPRWGATSESQWGHSPAMVAMGHIKAVNRLAALELASGEKALDPPQVVEERAIIGKLYNVPKGTTIMRDINKIKPLASGIQHYTGSMTIDRYQDQIREYFYIPQIDLRTGPAMTATEVQIRWEQMQRLMAPMAQRIKVDFLDPVVIGLARAMYRNDQLGEDIPEGVTPDMFQVVHHGMLSRSLRNDQTAAMERWVGGLLNMAEAKPEVLDVLNGTEYAMISGTTLDIPTRLINDEKEIAKAKAEREELLKRQQQAQTVMMENEAMNGGSNVSAIK